MSAFPAAALAGVLLSFLAGSIPFGVLLSRWVAGIDVREGGSGNIGATNVARTAGPVLGLLTLALDAAKGLLPVLLMRHVLLPLPVLVGLPEASMTEPSSGIATSEWWVAGAGIAALVGHCYTPWLGLKGGKGVATSLGVILAVAPLAALSGLVAFAVVFAPLRIASIGSFAGIAAAIPVAALTGGTMPGILTAAMGALVVLRHGENIRRLLSGSENRV